MVLLASSHLAFRDFDEARRAVVGVRPGDSGIKEANDFQRGKRRFGPTFGNFTHFNMFAPKSGNEYSFSRYRTEMKRLYELLEKRLGQVPYLGGEEYSIADIATFPWTRNHDAQGVRWEDNPNLARWFNAIAERPAVKAALAKIAVIKSNRETASDRATASAPPAQSPLILPAASVLMGGPAPQDPPLLVCGSRFNRSPSVSVRPFALRS